MVIVPRNCWTRRGQISVRPLNEAKDFLDKLPERFSGLMTLQQVTELRRVVDKREHLYFGSSKAETLAQYDEHLSKIHSAFEVFQRVHLRSLTTPREMDERESELTETLRLHRDLLSEAQKEVFQNALLALQERRQGEIEKALQWIEKYEAKPPRDTSILDDSPAFLPVEGKKRLKVLRELLHEQIQKRTDKENTDQILRQFAQLSPLKQKECLDLLQRQLANVLGSTV